MRLAAGKGVISVLLVCGVALVLEGIEHGHAVKSARDLKAEATHSSREDASIASARFEAREAPPMAMLLLRLQEIQSFLYLIENERADKLSAALFTLSTEVERSFAQQLYTPYAELSTGHQEAYFGVLEVIAALQVLLEKVEHTPPSSARTAEL